MTDTAISDAVAFPEDVGTGVTEGSEDYSSAGYFSMLAAYTGYDSYVGQSSGGLPTLQFTSVDTTNDTVTIGSGYAYIQQSDVSVQSGAQDTYDTTLPNGVPAVITLPTKITLQLDADSVNEVHLAQDPTVNDGVYLRHGSSVTTPSDPSLQLGTVNTSDGSTTRTNDYPSVTTDVLSATSELIDPSGVSHTSELADVTDLYSDTDTLDAIDGSSITPTSVTSTSVTNNNYIEPQVTATESTSYTADLSMGNYHKITLTGDVSFDISNVDSSDTNSLTLHLVQDSTGGRTPSFTPTIIWDKGSAPSWSTSAGAEDVITLVHDQDGSQWLGFVGGLGMA